uniref:non-ribosomal peptide synthetase n=1 Tax=Chryseobacterium sp. TaxID=1871047 RepID=UPI00321A914C
MEWIKTVPKPNLTYRPSGYIAMKLTPYQSTFYNEWILNPSRSDYNIIFDQSMSGYVDIQRLNSSLVRFVNNNLLLNSNVVSESENLVWKHRPLLPEDAQIVTFIANEPGADEILQLALQPFDLEKEQLARFYAIKLNNGGYRIIHIFSHILVDGLSANSIYAELSTFYNDLSYVNPVSLAEQEKRYEKLRNQLENILTNGKTEMSDFWKSGLEEVENIGFKFLQTTDSLLLDSQEKEPILANPVSELRFHFSESVFLKVRQLISKYKLTPYTYGQLVFAVLLHRISGVNNLVINYPVGIAEGQEFIFGAHINTILKGYRFEAKSSLQDLIHQNIEYTNQLKTSKARYLPIEELISHAPTSNILEFGFVQTSLKDVVIHYEGASNVIINNDLNVDLVGKLSFEQEVRDGQINYKVRYANQKLDTELISNFVDIYKRLFIEILEDLLEGKADQLISQYRLLSEDSYQTVINTWNAIDWDSQKIKTIHQTFENQVVKTPENIALVYQNTKLTYKELNERSNRLAHYLISTFDLKPDELVPLCLERSENMLIAILAVLKAGAAYVPMDPSYPADRIEYILKDTEARIILTEEDILDQIDHLSVPCISLNNSNFSILMDSQEFLNPVTAVSANNLAYVIYTSGTTGLPKGVMVEHQSVVNVVDKVRDAYGFSEEEKLTAYTSYVFDVSVSEFFNALFYGNELHLLDDATKKDADLISQYLLDNEIAYTYLPPVMLSVLPRVDYPSVKGFLYAGEPCDYETGKYWSEKKVLYNLYGPTEATIYAIYKRIEHGDVHVIGKPVGNSSAYIMDAYHQLTPVGMVGELYLGGAGITRGYLNRPDLTEERFIKNPFQTELQKQSGVNGRLYKTGDLVRWLPDGNIEYIGRNDFQVKIRGYRIELGEIEERLSQHPAIKQAVVLAKENSTGMKYLAGYYVSDEELDAEKLTEYLSETLPEYMVPNVFVQLTALPLTINGKLDRKQLPEPEFSGEREYTGPENELQEELCKIYGQILGLEPESIGIHDDFFRLGGNSIMAIKLISKIKQELEIPVNVAVVFGHKTVASLSHILDQNISALEPVIIRPIPVSQPEEQRLSFAQERLWFIESYEGNSSIYNVPMVFKLGENASEKFLQKVFDLLIQRHEVLRSIILTTEDGVGYQKVTDQKLKIYFGNVETRSELDQAIDYVANKVFHLDHELPINVSVFRMGEHSYLSVVIHHIAFDGWSTEVFINEFNAVYEALIEGKDPQLPVLPIQYKDFALWQRNYLSGEILEKQASYWKNKLEGFQTLDLPLDFKRPAHVSYTGATMYFDLPEQLVSGLQHLSKDLGVSLYSVMLGGYYLMLSAYSGQDDIVVGSPVANRHHAGLENIIGFFVNTFALRETIEPDQSIKDFIEQVSQSITNAQSHQDLPFEKLVEEMGVEQDNSRNPIFQVMFGIQSFEEKISHKNNETILLPFDGDIDYKSAKFDLTMMIDVHGDSIRGIFNYAVALFKNETVIRMKETYMLILEQLVTIENVASKNNKIRNLQLLNNENYQKITKDWNNIEHDYPEGYTIHRLFEDQVVKTPNATALVYQNIRLSYQELNERANRLANYLIETYKVQPDDLIPMCLERSENMLIAILGVLKSGAAYVPMDPQYPADRIQHILKDTQAKVIITEEASKDKIEGKDVHIISLNDTVSNAMLETASSHNPDAKVIPENLSYVIYTSGTTGMPKGVMIEHQNVVNVVSQIRDAYGFSEGEKITAYTSYVFDVSVSEFFNALLYGNELHILDEALKKDADSISQYLLEHDIAYAYLPPVMLSVLPKIEYPSLKGMLYAGEPCDYETGKYWSEYTHLYNLYGPTEATIYATYKKVEHGDIHLIGRPVNNTSAYVLDEYYRPVPIGAIGELYLGGNGIARGYLNRPDLTSERFLLNPFQTPIQKIRGKNGRIYKTGDLVRLHPDGNIEYIGRNDFQVKIRGYRIELGEIETKLQEYTGVKQAVVLAKENKAGLKFLAGYYVSDEAQDETRISAFLSETMPEYMIPAVYVHLEALPLTINGKLDRRALPEPEFAGAKVYTAPQTELQEKLCLIYGEIVGLDAEEISIHDDFFRLGGNSIMAIKLISKIKNYLDLRIQVTSVFNHKTIDSLSSFLETEFQEENIHIGPVTVSSPEGQRLSFAQERLWFIEAYEGGSSAYNIPMVLTLSPDVKLEELQKSLETVIKRHEVLRSVIKTTEKGIGYQMVTDAMPEFKIAEVNTEEELEMAINAVANKIFRLEEELPLDITLFRLKNQYYLSMVVHHIAFDGWSVDIVLKEIQIVYEALLNKTEHQLSELSVQYKDFALWQRNYLQGEVLDKQIKYWKERLEDFESLNLPLDFKRPAQISYEGAAIYFDLSPEVASGLRMLSKDLGVSLYSVMLGGYYLMLSAYSGQHDIIVGSPISNRHHAGLEDIVGFFVNTLALRGNVNSGQNFKNFILQVSQSVAEAQSHQDLPFEKLVEELGVEQDMSRHPVFQVMFGVQSFGRESGKDALFSLFEGEIDYQAAKFDLTTMIDDGEEKIKGMFNYAISLFSKDTILRMKDTYVLILEQIASMGTDVEKIKIDDFKFLTARDYKTVIENWNDTASEYPSDKTLHQLFEDQVAKTPDHIALVYQDIKLSYKELNERSNRLANSLIRKYNIQPDEIIPLCLERSENMLIAILGVLKSGGAYVPIDPSYPSDRIKHILGDTHARLVIGQESTVEQLKDQNTEFISLDEVQYKEQLEIADSNNPITTTKSENLAYVIYTSGTTGLPKGVMVEHQGVTNLVTQFAENLELTSSENFFKNCLWYANYVFDAHVAELFPVITHG